MVRLLTSPWMVLASGVLGILTGIYAHGLSMAVAPLGEIYLSLLQMMVIPILLTAIISSLARILETSTGMQNLIKVISIFAIGLGVSSAIGISAGLLGQPGADLSPTTRETLGKFLTSTDLKGGAPVLAAPKGFLGFIQEMIPSNPLAAISSGKPLPILFFSILFGLALGLVQPHSRDTTLKVLEALFEAGIKIMKWVLIGLPFGIFCIASSQLAKVGFETVRAMSRFVVVAWVLCLVILAAQLLIIWWRTKLPFKKVISGLKEPFLVAMGTSSSLAAMPSALSAVNGKLGRDREMTNLVIPLGTNLHKQGACAYFSLIVVFMSQLYGVPLGFQTLLIAVFGSILAALAATGAPGPASLAMLAIALGPLGLPTEVAILLIIAVDIVLDPVLTLTNVLGNCAAATLLAAREKSNA